MISESNLRFGSAFAAFKVPSEVKIRSFSGLLIVLNPVPDVPDVPELPDVPDVPDEPDVPELPDEPEIPDVPDVPDEPARPLKRQTASVPPLSAPVGSPI